MFRQTQSIILNSILLLAACLLCGCAADRHLPSRVTAIPPRIDPITAVADRSGVGIAPVSFRTGVQKRQCAGSS